MAIEDSPSKEVENTTAAPWTVIKWGSDERIVDIANALIESPDHTIEIIKKYDARYVMVTYRMFPFNAYNTGIYYAPLLAANKNKDDYFRTQISTNYGYLTEEEAEEYAKFDPNFEFYRQDLEYEEAFYDSMFYRAYIGYSGLDLGTYKNAGIPRMTFSQSDLGHREPMQGWNLKNFKLVYKTTYYSTKNESNARFPDDFISMNYIDAKKLVDEQGGFLVSGLRTGAIILKYYEGAIVRGTVTSEDGNPVPYVRVTVQDEYGIPHDSVITDAKGRYNVTAPFGEVQLKVSTGGWIENPSENMDVPTEVTIPFGDFEIVMPWPPWGGSGTQSLTEKEIENRISQVEFVLLNQTNITISENQSMRLTPDWIIDDIDINVKPCSLNGSVYWDMNADEEYQEGIDELIKNAKVTLQSYDSDGILYYNATTDENGYFDTRDILPGNYKFILNNSDNEVNLYHIMLEPGDITTLNCNITPASINGTIVDAEGNPLADISINISKIIDDYNIVPINSTITDQSGYYEFKMLLPGTYKIEIDSEYLEKYSENIVLTEGEESHNSVKFYYFQDVTPL